MKLYTILIACCLGLLTSCAAVRVFQKKVPADLTEKPAEQKEGEKRAAAFIQLRSAPPVGNPGQAVAEIHEVSNGLVSSLGLPDVPVKQDDFLKIIAELQNANIAKDKQLEAWKAFGRKYAGKELEGTGVDLGPWLGTGGLIAVIALCVLCPPIGWAVLRGVPILWGMVRRMATGVEAFAKAKPKESDKLKVFLGQTMNELDKRIVKSRKSNPKVQVMATKMASNISVVAAA